MFDERGRNNENKKGIRPISYADAVDVDTIWGVIVADSIDADVAAVFS